ERRAQERRESYPVEQRLADGDATHQCDAGDRGSEPDRTRNDKITARDLGHIQRSDAERHRIEQISNEVADQRSQSHWSEACYRIPTDAHLEPKTAAPRRPSNRPGDPSRRSASDEHPQVPAA